MSRPVAVPPATATGRPVRVAEPLLAHIRSKFADDSIVYSAPPRPLGGMWRYVLAGLPDGVPVEQVVRLVTDQAAVAIEATISAAAFDGGIPAPEVVVDGRDFLATAFVGGSPLLATPSSRGVRVGGQRTEHKAAAVLGALLAQLHEVDPTPVAAALCERGADDALGLDRPLRLIENDIGIIGEPTLATAYERLLATRPTNDGRVVVCHGRLGPRTVRQVGGRVTAITGWESAVIADPAYDVGATRAALRLHSAPVGDGSEVVAAFLRVYDDLVGGDDDHAREWFETLHCLRFVARSRCSGRGDTTPLGYPEALRSATGLISARTGIDIHLSA